VDEVQGARDESFHGRGIVPPAAGVRGKTYVFIRHLPIHLLPVADGCDAEAKHFVVIRLADSLHLARR